MNIEATDVLTMKNYDMSTSSMIVDHPLSSNTIIQVNDFNLFYDKHQALHNINLNIEAKQISALIGPSGCGKSTLLRSINRMNDLIPSVKTQGVIQVMGQNVYSPLVSLEKLRKVVGLVFQHPSPFPKSIYENVAFGPRLFGIKSTYELDGIVEKSLKQAALWKEVKDKLHKSALSLSGGQQQRLCIARTLAIEPQVILMDEPTSALDPASTAKIEALLISLKEQYTIVIVTHNMQQAKRISDKVAFFLNGELIEYNSTEEIFKHSKSKLTRDYVHGKFG